MGKRTLIYLILMPLIVATIVFGVSRIRFNVEILDVLPGDIPEVQAPKAYREHFTSPNKLVMTFSSESEQQTLDGAREVITALQERELIGYARWETGVEVDADAGAEMLAYLWLNSEPEELTVWTDQVSTEAGRDAVLGEQLERLSEPMMVGSQASFSVQYDPYDLLGHPFVGEMMKGDGAGGDQHASKDGKFRVAFCDLPQEFDGYPALKVWLDGVKATTEEIKKAEGLEDVRVRFTGEPPYVEEISTMMERDMSGTMGWTVLIVVLLFWFMQRRVMPLILLALALGVVFGLTMAVGGIIYGKLTVMSIGFAAILVGLAADYGVLVAQYQTSFSSTAKEIRKTLMPSILWASLTTAAVFFALNFSEFPGVRQLGTLVGSGILIGALVMLTVYTDALCWLKKKFGKREIETAAATMPGPVRALAKRGGLAALGLTVLGGCVLIFGGMPRVDYRLRSMEDMPLESMHAFMEIRERVSSWEENHLPLISDAETPDEVRAALQRTQETAEKLEAEGVLIDAVVPLAMWPSPDDQQVNRVEIQKVVAAWPAMKAAADEAGFTEEALALTGKVIANWERWLAKGDGLIMPESKHAKDTLSRFISIKEDSSAALSLVTPANYMQSKVDDFRTLAPLNSEDTHLAAWQALRVTIRELLIHDATYVLLPVVGVLFLMLIIVFRSVRDVMLSIASIFIAGVVLNAWMFLTGQSWNFQSMAAIPVLLGTGLDFVIHVILALRRYGDDLGKFWQGTGKAVIFCGLTTATGFGSLGFADDPGLAQLGVICSAGILTMMLVAVFLLPGWRKLDAVKSGGSSQG